MCGLTQYAYGWRSTGCGLGLLFFVLLSDCAVVELYGALRRSGSIAAAGVVTTTARSFRQSRRAVTQLLPVTTVCAYLSSWWHHHTRIVLPRTLIHHFFLKYTMAFSAALFNRLHSSAAALTDRQRARFTSERVQGDEEAATLEHASDGAEVSAPPQDEEEGHFTNETAHRDTNEEEAVDLTDPAEDDEEEEITESLPRSPPNFYRSTMTLAELEEERELARRRMSACVLLTVFVLFKLWIDCIAEPSVPLLMVCLIGTSWTARWIRYNREREEELDRRIAQYLQANQASNNDTDNNTGIIDRNELRMLSFQAQLALAIMESQRHMLEGGRPDDEPQTPGVSDDARSHWKTVDFEKMPQYGSTAEKTKDNMDGPHCSICLCEYEADDALVQLPCGHVYHRECIDSWTANHQKCPLCNFDLESVTSSDRVDQIV
jgi:hypothetical protein